MWPCRASDRDYCVITFQGPYLAGALMNPMAPNLFLLGAAKCGTTSLHAILGQHPDIHACWGKEPTFFNWPFQVVRNPLEYFRLFDSPKRYRLDSSGAYL